MSPAHLHVVGDRERRRLACVPTAGAPLIARCHRNLRGPYTGIDTFLRELLTQAVRRRPELVEEYRLVLLYGMPELAEIVGTPPRDLAARSDFAERTRFYGASMIRCMNQGIVTFVKLYTADLAEDGLPAPTVIFDGVQHAAKATQELLALLVRRVPASQLRVVVGSTGSVTDELAVALEQHAERMIAPPIAPEPAALASELVARFIASDGTDDDPACLVAYSALADGQRAALHDLRADELEPVATWSIRIGALAYHREHGSDPSGAGSAALARATQQCTEAGFSDLVVELGYRGRAVTDPERDEVTFRKLTIQMSSALIPCGRVPEAIELLHDLRRRYTSAQVHMMTSYALAMMYTRFVIPRDHELAVEWQNNAITIAALLADEQERLMFTGFQDNAMALIQMHRGNLADALVLVENALHRADTRMADDALVLHRSQLLYNRARLLAGLGRKDEAYQIFTSLSELDPHYTDYLSERAKISRKRGELESALADYDSAVRLGAPFHELFYNRGSVRMELDDTDGAARDFDHVLDMEPDDVETRVIRAELRLSTGDLAGAGCDVAAGLSIRPLDPRLLCLRGTLKLADNLALAAIADFDAALAIDAGYPAALVNRAVARFETGEPEAAAGDLTAALEMIGDDPDLLLNRGLARAATGDLDAALADVERALLLPEADVAELSFRRGSWLLTAGNMDQALEDLQLARSHDHRVAEIDGILASSGLLTR